MDYELVEMVGWVGSILLAFCGMPQAIQSFKTGSSEGVTWGLVLMWGLGEVLTMAYILPKMDMPLLFNYGSNIAFISVIMYYKIWPRKS